MPHILIVDDDIHLRKLILTYAQLENFQCREAENSTQALQLLHQMEFDIILLDVMMPGADGFQTLARIREFSQTPVIMLTARSEEYDRLLGFNLGADDYVPKPFSPKELMARVNAVLRRAGKKQPDNTLRCGAMTIRLDTRTVYLEETPINLPPKEFDLLTKLAWNEHIVFSREQLLNTVWGFDYYGDTRTVDTHVKSLREHLGTFRNYIVTVWGVGYKFEQPKKD